MLVCWLGDFQRPKLVRRPHPREAGAAYREGSVVGVIDPFHDSFGQPCRDVREVWVMLTKVGDAGVLESQNFLVVNTCFTQQPAVLNGCVLQFAQELEYSFDFPIALLVGTHLVLQRNGVLL